MMQSSSELRKKARDILPGSYSMFVLAMGASFFLTTILNRFLVLFPALPGFALAYAEDTVLSFFSTLLLAMLRTGLLFMALNVARRGRASLSDLFLAFRYDPGRAAALCAVLALIETVVTFPMDYVVYSWVARGFIALPGLSAISGPGAIAAAFAVSLLISLFLAVVISFPFSQAVFLYIDHQEYSAIQCLAESRDLMRGHILEYTRLHLDFIGYFALCVISFGLGLLWVLPYLNVTRSGYYMQLTGNYHPY